MSDDFQRDALAPLMCPRYDCGSTRHALNQLRVENKHLRAEIERLQREWDALKAENDRLRAAINRCQGGSLIACCISF